MGVVLAMKNNEAVSTVANKVLERGNHDGPITTNAKTTNKATTDRKITFFVLPAELRLHIYEELLVQEEGFDIPRWCFGQLPDPTILRTCKQIHSEATSILYSQNTLIFNDELRILKIFPKCWFFQLSLDKRMHLWVSSHGDLTQWLQVLRLLATEATGLRYLKIEWNAIAELPWARERGFGDNVEFVRALGKIRGLEKLAIQGFYAKN